MKHSIGYLGYFDQSFRDLKPGVREYKRQDGTVGQVDKRPQGVDGIFFGYMECEGKDFVAVRAQYGRTDVVLKNPVPLDSSRHTDGKGFGPKPSHFGDESAKRLLADMIKTNLDKRQELERISYELGWNGIIQETKMKDTIRVTVWNEYRHEKTNEKIAKLYPDGIHGAIANYLKAQPGMEVRTATLDEPEHGLTDEVLNNTDVLTWWGHMAHGEVSDAVVDKVHARVLSGMGLIVLHSAHFSKIFRKLMGTTCNLKWREIGEKERLWVVEPGHPIAAGLGEYIEIEHTEMYGERFDIPQPDTLVFISWFAGGEVFRSGCCFHRGAGKIFYFRPGHETLPIYHHEGVLRVIANAVRWAAPAGGPKPTFGNVKPLEKV